MRELVKCPECGADMQVGDVAAYVPHLEQHGLAGIGLVVLHALPVCERWQERHARLLDDAQHMVTESREREEERKREADETKREVK